MTHEKSRHVILQSKALSGIVCSFLLLFSAAQAPADEKPCPIINTSIDQEEIDPGHPTKFSIWIEGGPEVHQLPPKMTLIFVSNAHVWVEPGGVDLESSGKRQQATLHLKGLNPGLVSLVGKVPQWPRDCTALNLPVDTGLNSIATLNSDLVQTNPITGARDHLYGGRIWSFVILFRNLAGNNFRIGAPVTIILDAASGKLSTDKQHWNEQVPVPAVENSTQSETIFLSLPNGSETNAKIHVHVRRAGGGRDLLSGEVAFDYDYPWWGILLAIMGGCVIYSCIEALSAKKLGKFTWGSFSYKVALVLAIGGSAYILADSKILGFEVDKTTIKGNILLGILVGCLGLEGIINRIREFAHAGSNPAPPAVKPNPTPSTEAEATAAEAKPAVGTDASEHVKADAGN
jgi:hypothetical protein